MDTEQAVLEISTREMLLMISAKWIPSMGMH